MKASVILLTVFGLIAAVSAAVLVKTISRPPAPVTKVESDPEVTLLTAARPLPAMTVVDAAAVVSKTVRKSEVPPGGMSNSVQVVGRVLTRPMVEGELFAPSCFAADGLGLHLAAALPQGKRAVSISLREHSGMAGILYPGSVVDVLVSLQGPGSGEGRKEGVATTLLQGIQVMAVGHQTVTSAQEFKDKNPGALASKGEINFRMVTLLVTPKQAEILQLATQYGTVALTMRNPLDNRQVAQDITRMGDFTGTGRSVGYQLASWASGFLQSRAEQSKLAAAAQASARAAAQADDPFAAAPSTQPAAPTNPLWEMLVVRGSTSEKRSFPMSEVIEPPDETAQQGSRPQAAQPAAGAAPGGAG